jgi:hypothetical protein
MAMDFPSPSYRAGTGDLAISISPTGLIELSDEEYEVHGQRMIRYANSAAMYFGHHWSYRKPAGEPQLVFNYIKALSDFLVSFTFSKGLNFKVPRAYQHIIPALLDRVFTVDNDKEKFLWEIGQLGSIFGDVFVKVAYKEAWQDDIGMVHPGRVLLLPLNPATCFPRWHAHEPGRLEEFKLKYKFWDTAPDGTRIMNTYVEIITDHDIKEYINDQLIRENPNPIGEIPIVHIANQISPGSPWGMSDIAEIIPINREYNEKATDISDIISYHAAPITVVTGGTPPELEKGPSKIWGLKNDKSKVYNLEGGFAGLPHAIEHLQRLKTNMHEMTGVPVTALGQEQPISNTSGVALAIQYFHTMMKYGIKQTTYGHGLKRITRLVLLHLFIKEPETLAYNPNTDGIKEEGQSLILDMQDPDVYRVDLEWPPPLPVDSLIKLGEIEKKMMLNLESRRGAMRDMGEQFPDEKLEELFLETKEDLVHAAAIDIIKSKIQSFIMEAFGVVPEGGGEPVPPEPAPAGNGAGGAAATASKPKPPPGLGSISALVQGMDSGLIQEIVTQATLPRVPSQRNIDKGSQGQAN